MSFKANDIVRDTTDGFTGVVTTTYPIPVVENDEGVKRHYIDDTRLELVESKEEALLAFGQIVQYRGHHAVVVNPIPGLEDIYNIALSNGAVCAARRNEIEPKGDVVNQEEIDALRASNVIIQKALMAVLAEELEPKFRKGAKAMVRGDEVTIANDDPERPVIRFQSNGAVTAIAPSAVDLVKKDSKALKSLKETAKKLKEESSSLAVKEVMNTFLVLSKEL